MQRIKPKVNLDEAVLDLINTFLGVRLGERALGWECFSHPDLNVHECNPYRKLKGDHACEHCNNIFGRHCPITCHIHHVCLAAYGYRLGVGGDEFWVAISHNLRYLSFEQLYTLVQEAVDKKNDATLGAYVPQDRVQLALFRDRVNKRKGSQKKKPKTDLITEDGFALLPLSEAAKRYGCSYVNVYSHVERGNLRKHRIDNILYVREDDLDALMVKRRNRKNQKQESVND